MGTRTRAKRFALLLSLLLMLGLFFPFGASALEDGERVLHILPGESWTLSNTAQESVSLRPNASGSPSGYDFVTADADGNVTSRAAALYGESKEIVIPAQGQAIVQGYASAYGLVLPQTIEAEKDETPALLHAQLHYHETCAFVNTAPHSANVLIRSVWRAATWVVTDSRGEPVAEDGSFIGTVSSTTEDVVSVPAGGRVVVTCNTAAMSGSADSNVPGYTVICMARSAFFRLEEHTEAPLLFTYLVRGETRSFTNITDRAQTIYSRGRAVLYNTAGKPESFPTTEYLTVPAGYTAALTGSGALALPRDAFEEQDVGAFPGLRTLHIPVGISVRVKNVSGDDVTLSGIMGYAAIFHPSGLINELDGKDPYTLTIPAGCSAVLTGLGTLESVDGQLEIDVSEDPAAFVTEAYSGDAFRYTNYSGSKQRLYYNGIAPSVSYGGQENYQDPDNGSTNRGARYVYVPAGASATLSLSQNSTSKGTVYGAYKAFRVERLSSSESADRLHLDPGNTVVKVTNSKSSAQTFNCMGKIIKLSGRETVYVPSWLPSGYGFASLTNKYLTITAATVAPTEWLHVLLQEGESCEVTNISGEAVSLFCSGAADVLCFDAAGAVTAKGLYGASSESLRKAALSAESTVVPVPAGGKVRLTAADGWLTLDGRAADFALNRDCGSVSVRMGLHAGEVCTFTEAFNCEITGPVEKALLGNQPEFGSSAMQTAITPYSGADFVGFAYGSGGGKEPVDCRAAVTEGPLYETVTLNRGESCVFSLREGAYRTELLLSKPVWQTFGGSVSVYGNASAYQYYDGSPNVFTAVMDDTVIRYAPSVTELSRPGQSAIVTLPVKQGKDLDLTALQTAENGDEVCLTVYGLAPLTRFYRQDGTLSDEQSGSERVWMAPSDPASCSANIAAEGSELLIAAVRGSVDDGSSPVMLTDWALLDRSGGTLSGIDAIRETGLDSVRVTLKTGKNAPAKVVLLLAAYDEDGQMLQCATRSLRGDAANGETVLPFACGEETASLRLIITDGSYAPLMPRVLLAGE